MKDYPAEICCDCGEKYGRWPVGHVATFYRGTCGWCGKEAVVTEPRDFSHPPAPGTTAVTKKK